ncbi:uncharacterized protein EV420DRAFT_1481750 [Desarmillaria tabescens]|uniref:Uncharacterized protein n=1 Tax=Armillaria tabescens TaxID=1929756 RepID=A0AA39K470_ARMTA|nr:uncharacterized protein EV420DRAFT_1481750 [Desarmillaria tabescens]KAK0454028.1 hypothetical protein EV420DRAFT_1481750 [Desarmillaria tabescens]
MPAYGIKGPYSRGQVHVSPRHIPSIGLDVRVQPYTDSTPRDVLILSPVSRSTRLTAPLLFDISCNASRIRNFPTKHVLRYTKSSYATLSGAAAREIQAGSGRDNELGVDHPWHVLPSFNRKTIIITDTVSRGRALRPPLLPRRAVSTITCAKSLQLSFTPPVCFDMTYRWPAKYVLKIAIVKRVLSISPGYTTLGHAYHHHPDTLSLTQLSSAVQNKRPSRGTISKNPSLMRAATPTNFAGVMVLTNN